MSRDLLRKTPAERLTTASLLSAPLIFPKVNSFPQSYRPRYLEERIRRSHLRQLEQQLDSVTMHRRQSLSIAAVGRGKSSANLNTSFSFPMDSPPGHPAEGFGRVSPLLEDLAGSTSEKVARTDSKPMIPSSISPSAEMFASVAAPVITGEIAVTEQLTSEQILRASVSELVLDDAYKAAAGPVSVASPLVSDKGKHLKQLHDSLSVDGNVPTSKNESSSTPHGGRKGLELANAKRQDQEIVDIVSELQA